MRRPRVGARLRGRRCCSAAWPRSRGCWHADGIVCVDAFGFAPDPKGVLREMRRILRPGGRAVLTSGSLRSRPVAPPWPERAAAAGLELEWEEERPHEPAMWSRLYRLWTEHEADLRLHLGDDQAESMLTEARTRSRTVGDRRSVTVTLKRPGCKDEPSRPRPDRAVQGHGTKGR
ncbi:class I SAM-dependent methyltransferase [Streptomyces odonnellii]|uniref:class I SAM-dependent methyltransferase n=1 Tax=Streptomyces odonnellii TaxID=1417980 RepID=UPI0012FEDDB8